MITKNDLYVLRDMKAEIIADAKELRRLENAEQNRISRRRSILHSFAKAQSPADIQMRKDVLMRRLTKRQEDYLIAQAELEQKIAAISDHYVRLVLSLTCVDLLTYKEAAAQIGCNTSPGGLQQLISRYMAKEGFHDSF